MSGQMSKSTKNKTTITFEKEIEADTVMNGAKNVMIFEGDVPQGVKLPKFPDPASNSSDSETEITIKDKVKAENMYNGPQNITVIKTAKKNE